MYATNEIGTDIGAFTRATASKTATYSSGETIVLPSTPINEENLLVRYNKVLTLRPGVDFDLSGNTITLLWGESPTVGDPDVFAFFYATQQASALLISGWKQYTYNQASAAASGMTFNLPHTPITGSLLIWMDDNLSLDEGVQYNLTGDEIEILFALDAVTSFFCWYAY